MTSQPHTPSSPHRSTDSSPGENDSIRARGMHAANAQPPPQVPYRGFRSISDDGQPDFPRVQRARRTVDGATVPESATNENHPSPFFSVRVYAILAIVAIIAALVASA